MKKILCGVIIGLLCLSFCGLNAANAQPPKNDQDQQSQQEKRPPECKPTKEHPCPPPKEKQHPSQNQSDKHRQDQGKKCVPTKERPCPPPANESNRQNEHQGQPNKE
jgi:hypothetical protein